MNDRHIRQQLVKALSKRQAHQSFEAAIEGFPPAHFNTMPANLPYSFWHLLEHMRIAQADILDYIENPQYQYLDFPADYWPAPEAQADSAIWGRTIDAFRADQAALVAIVQDPARDVCAQIPHGEPGHSIMREILVVAAHNSYHIGEFGCLRGTLDLW
ncbi:MAG: DinB family protein [Chloroflexota bacterium]|nr:DinB family protein [Chloroflexota bacterium]MDE2947992.1 DinB family protein [Chloroflexota bacterium]